MKQQKNSKYQGTKFHVFPKHKNTFAFVSGNIAEVLKMPAYNSAGRLEYVRKLPPVRDLKNIDLSILAKFVKEVDPKFNINDIQLQDGICTTAGGSRFRYKDLFQLLQLLRKENLFTGSNDQIKELKAKYYESD